RAEAVRDDAAGRLPGVLRELLELRLGVGRGVDEPEDRNVIPRLRLGEELLRRSRRLHTRLLPGIEDLLRPVLRALHVRLVERVDAEDRAGAGGGELPPEELLAELVIAGEPHLLPLPVGPVRGLPRGGHEPLALLARRLRKELLGPQPEAARVRRDADL